MTGSSYDGIDDAVDTIVSHSSYPGAENLLSDPPSESEIECWTATLSGFEAKTTVSGEDHSRLIDIDHLYESSKPNLEQYANELEVKQLSGCKPDRVLYMVCIRDLQQQFASKENMNPHKFAVLRASRYSVIGDE